MDTRSTGGKPLPLCSTGCVLRVGALASGGGAVEQWPGVHRIGFIEYRAAARRTASGHEGEIPIETFLTVGKHLNASKNTQVRTMLTGQTYS